MNPKDLEAWSKLVSAVAQLLWPIAFVIVVWLFRRDLSSILNRLRKGKVLGQEVELDPRIAELEKKTEKAVEEVDARVRLTPVGPKILEGQEREDALKRLGLDKPLRTTSDEDQILRLAVDGDPSIAVMKLGSLLEEDIRTLGAHQGIERSGRMLLRGLIEMLADKGTLPPHLVGSLRAFYEVRNKLVHGVADGIDPLRVIDTGLTLLRTLRTVGELA